MIAKITTRRPLSSGSLAELVFHATAERKIRYYLEPLDTIIRTSKDSLKNCFWVGH